MRPASGIGWCPASGDFPRLSCRCDVRLGESTFLLTSSRWVGLSTLYLPPKPLRQGSPNADLCWSISRKEQDQSSSPLRSGAYLFAATRRGPRRDKARACRETTATALDVAKHFPAARSAKRGRSDRGGSGIEGVTASCLRVGRSRGIGHQPCLLRPDQTLASPVQLV